MAPLIQLQTSFIYYKFFTIKAPPLLSHLKAFIMKQHHRKCWACCLPGFSPLVYLFIIFSLSWILFLLSAFCFCGFQLCLTQARLQFFDPPVFLPTLRSSAFTKSMLQSCLSSTKKVCHVLEHPASNSPAFSHPVGWIPSLNPGTAKSAWTRLQEEQQENPLACPASGNLWHDWKIYEYFWWLSCFTPWHQGAKKCGISTCMLQCATHPHYPIMEAMGVQNGNQHRQSEIH